MITCLIEHIQRSAGKFILSEISGKGNKVMGYPPGHGHIFCLMNNHHFGRKKLWEDVQRISMHKRLPLNGSIPG